MLFFLSLCGPLDEGGMILTFNFCFGGKREKLQFGSLYFGREHILEGSGGKDV